MQNKNLFTQYIYIIMKYLFMIVVIILIVILLCNKSKNDKENFSTCLNCSYLDERECGSCSNCGFCISPDGSGECVPGDVNGPYFKSDCMIWKHPQQFRYYTPRFYGRYFHQGWNHPRYTRRRTWKRGCQQ
jgi:hypothetical protein